MTMLTPAESFIVGVGGSVGVGVVGVCVGGGVGGKGGLADDRFCHRPICWLGVRHCCFIFLTLVTGVAVVFVFVTILPGDADFSLALLPCCCTTIHLYS